MTKQEIIEKLQARLKFCQGRIEAISNHLRKDGLSDREIAYDDSQYDHYSAQAVWLDKLLDNIL